VNLGNAPVQIFDAVRKPASVGPEPWLALVACLVLIIGSVTITRHVQSGKDEVRFENAVQSATDRITGRLDLYAGSLINGAAFVSTAPDMTPEEFHTFAGRIDLQRRFPGIQGYGWTERIERTAEGEERHAIQMLYPMDRRNQAAIGFDMYSEPKRRTAMARARDSGEPALSGIVTLVQEITPEKQVGFLLYVPVYSTLEVPRTVEERSEQLRGFVYAPFRADDLFNLIFGTEESPRVTLRVYDASPTDRGALIYAFPAEEGHRPRYTAVDTIVVAGHPWTVEFASAPTFEAATAIFNPWLALSGGLLITFLVFGLSLSQANARRQAQAANQAKMQFLATMSHELRTPLNAIAGFVDLIDAGIYGPVTRDQVNALTRIKLANAHLLSLIDNVLNFAKIEAGRAHYCIQPIEMEEVVAGVETIILDQAASRRIEYRRDPSPRLSVAADPDKLRQILLNLLSNAVKFTDQEGSITISWEQVGRQIAIHVADSGIGIAPSKVEAAFAPFVQVDASLTRNQQGTGLGLAISRELAHGMEGELSVTSHLGLGSVFTLRLPLADWRAREVDSGEEADRRSNELDGARF
jgi:signal transduction histidine kinase